MQILDRRKPLYSLPRDFKVRYIHNTWFCKQLHQSTFDKIVYGSREKCVEACALNSQCKSFDFCYKDQNDSFCHLKDKSNIDI